MGRAMWAQYGVGSTLPNLPILPNLTYAKSPFLAKIIPVIGPQYKTGAPYIADFANIAELFCPCNIIYSYSKR
jgi:hypothetical protein